MRTIGADNRTTNTFTAILYWEEDVYVATAFEASREAWNIAPHKGLNNRAENSHLLT